MTKKDYELIAKALQHAKPSWNILPEHLKDSQGYRTGRDDAWTNACKTLAEYLAKQDKRFKRDRFLKDCGVTD